MANLLKIQKRKYFGTDGIRGSISRETNPEFILKLGWAAGKVFEEEGIKAIVIGKGEHMISASIDQKAY